MSKCNLIYTTDGTRCNGEDIDSHIIIFKGGETFSYGSCSECGSSWATDGIAKSEVDQAAMTGSRTIIHCDWYYAEMEVAEAANLVRHEEERDYLGNALLTLAGNDNLVELLEV